MTENEALKDDQVNSRSDRIWKKKKKKKKKKGVVLVRKYLWLVRLCTMLPSRGSRGLLKNRMSLCHFVNPIFGEEKIETVAIRTAMLIALMNQTEQMPRSEKSYLALELTPQRTHAHTLIARK